MAELIVFGVSLTAVVAGGACVLWPARIVVVLNGEPGRDPRTAPNASVVVAAITGLLLIVFGVVLFINGPEMLFPKNPVPSPFGEKQQLR